MDLIDRARRLHGSDGVLDDRLAGDLDQLIGDVEANPRTGSTCQDDGQIAQLAEGGHSRTVSADQQGSAQASTLGHLVTHR